MGYRRGGGWILAKQFKQPCVEKLNRSILTSIIEFDFLGYRDIFREQNGKKAHWVCLYFKVLVNPDQVKDGEPHKLDEVRWFTVKAIPENIYSKFYGFFNSHK